MEEILASIRRIIADDDIPKAAHPDPLSRPRMAAQMPASEPEPVFEEPPLTYANEPGATSFDPMFEEPERGPEEPAYIVELTQDMRAPEAQAAALRAVETYQEVGNAEPERGALPPQMEEPPAMAMAEHLESARQALAEQMDRPLLSNSASAAVDTAFSSLAHTVLSQNARTLDDLVKEMLRPMLKTWLDDNLPGLVERLVRAEIERVSRGR